MSTTRLLMTSHATYLAIKLTKESCFVSSCSHVGSHCLVLILIPPWRSIASFPNRIFVRVVVVDKLSSQCRGSIIYEVLISIVYWHMPLRFILPWGAAYWCCHKRILKEHAILSEQFPQLWLDIQRSQLNVLVISDYVHCMHMHPSIKVHSPVALVP